MMGMLVRAVIFGLGVEVGRELYQHLKDKAGKGHCTCHCHETDTTGAKTPVTDDHSNGGEKTKH